MSIRSLTTLSATLKSAITGMLTTHSVPIRRTPGLTNGIDAYQKIMSSPSLTAGTVSSDATFQTTFTTFYKLFVGSGVSKTAAVPYRKKYFAIFDKYIKLKNAGKRFTYEDVFRDVSAITGKNESSFSSKIYHTLFPDYPIYDSVVGIKHLGFSRPRTNADYEDYCNYFSGAMVGGHVLCSPSDRAWLLGEFRRIYPASVTFTDAKVLDFVLWIDRKPQLL